MGVGWTICYKGKDRGRVWGVGWTICYKSKDTGRVWG